MDNRVNERLKGFLQGGELKNSIEPLYKLLSSPEGQKLMNSLSDEDKKAIYNRFMSLDKSKVQESLKSFNPSMLKDMTAQDILNKLR